MCAYVAIRREGFQHHSCGRYDALQGDHAKSLSRMTAFCFTMMCEVAPVQIGGEDQRQFIAWPERELFPALRHL